MGALKSKQEAGDNDSPGLSFDTRLRSSGQHLTLFSTSSKPSLLFTWLIFGEKKAKSNKRGVMTKYRGERKSKAAIADLWELSRNLH